ncbi:hypothetical protein QBC38DRAFT_376134 [Podospora fimiseda]|uniref:RNA ligase domain-containing protein n=1 Tax=Podospora fimiseda TaxID=252190 RepID=A0AAN7BGL7_9PEZI|nr:hypothetical protein QBC38DRAFT_376134 [Podospora fimiseda]
MFEVDVARRLVTVRRVSAVLQTYIPGTSYQHLEIDGWLVIFKVGYVATYEHRMPLRAGDLVVFFELDSWIPANAPIDKVRLDKAVRIQAQMNGVDGYRVCTHTHTRNHLTRGRTWDEEKFISEGFVVELRRIPDIQRAYLTDRSTARNNGLSGEALDAHMRTIDYSHVLGVVKYEKRGEALNKDVINPKAPKFVLGMTVNSYEKCQNMFPFAPKYKVAPKYIYQMTTKLDGAAMTVYFVTRKSKYYPHLPSFEDTSEDYKKRAVFRNGRFGVCSAKCDISRDTNGPNTAHYFWTAVKLYLNLILHKLGEDIVIQGELVGHKVSENAYQYKKQAPHDFFVSGIYNPNTGYHWNTRRVAAFAAEHKLKHVPIRGEVMIPDLASNFAGLQALADELEESQGLVFRRMQDPERCFKVLNKNWEAVKAAGRARVAPVAPVGVAGPVQGPTQPDAATSAGDDASCATGPSEDQRPDNAL